MIRHLAKLLDLLWYTSIGLFLGLHAGTILAVVEAFDSSRKVNAMPGIEPYMDARFAEQANDLVAGFMAQNMFKNGGSVVLVLLGIALLSRMLYPVLIVLTGQITIGSMLLSRLRIVCVLVSAGLMLYGAQLMMQMNESWPELYEFGATQETLDLRRAAFDASHQMSERVVGGAWFIAALALVVSPWCKRMADPDLESADGQEEND